MTRLLPVLVMLAACGPTADPPTPPIPPVPPKPVSFSADVMPVLKAKCSGCHQGQYEQAATTFSRLQGNTAANAACANTPRIVVRDGAGSLLVRKMNGTAECGAVMPLVKMGTVMMPCAGEQCVSEAEVAKVKGWIDEGALDN